MLLNVFLSVILTSALQLGFIPNDSTVDNTPTLNQAVQAGESSIEFEKGTYYFKSAPNQITTPLMIKGAGINSTNLRRAYDEPDLNKALLHTTATLNLSELSITSEGVGGGAIRLEGLGASGSVLRDLYISATAGKNWAVPVTLFSTHPLGIRTTVIDNVKLFAATAQLLWLVNVQGLTANFEAYPAGGTTNQMTIQDYQGLRSNNIMIETTYLEKLWIYNTSNISVRHFGTSIQCNGVYGLKQS